MERSENLKQNRTFIEKFAAGSLRWVPDSMVFVIVLTMIVAIMALTLTDSTIISVIDNWVEGFWNLLTFSMQMTLIMVTGFAVADAPIIKRGLNKLASIPKTARSAYVTLFIASAVIAWFHWGVGMMGGVMLGRAMQSQLKDKGIKIHANLICGICTIYGPASHGISHAAPLLVATPGHFMEKWTGIITLDKTILTPLNLIHCLCILVIGVFVVIRCMPKDDRVEEASDEYLERIRYKEPERVISATPAEKMSNSRILAYIIGIAGAMWIIKFIAANGVIGLNINVLNFIFLMLALLLHGTPNALVASIQKGISSVTGIVLQFPFYAGIFGIIAFSGLSEVMVGWFLAISTQKTFPVVAFIYSSILNLFVPSGGSKFVIEAPYIVPAALKLGTRMPSVINAYTFGDITTNLIQPFWALPVLALFERKFSEILPYGVIMCVCTWIFNVIFIYFFF